MNSVDGSPMRPRADLPLAPTTREINRIDKGETPPRQEDLLRQRTKKEAQAAGRMEKSDAA
jgi:hypothetical protein